MSVRLFSVASTLLLGIALFTINPTLSGQEGHQEENSQLVSEQHEDSHHGESVEGHQGEASSEEFNASEYIMEHVKDSHDWHILTKKDGSHVAVPLPVIVYSKTTGLHAFLSNKIAHGHTHEGFRMGHGVIMVENKKGETVEKSLDGKIVEVDEHGEMVTAGLPLDFSITKNVFMMMLSVIILLLVFLGLAKSYRKAGVSEPKGLMGFIEPVIVFIEEDVAIPNIGKDKYARFMPYLLTVFFFILINNLMGLIPFFPFGANVTGNIAVTFVLATCTFFITQFSANKGYWNHIFNTPGVPKMLAPIMIPVEIIGLFTKPFALMIRLFANITAGHIIILSLVSLIFVFKSIFLAVPSLIMVLFMDCIELLVAFLQAYIFTLLSALFIGMAMPEHHHD